MPEMNYSTQYQDLIKNILGYQPKPAIDPLTQALLSMGGSPALQTTNLPQTNRLGQMFNEGIKTFAGATKEQDDTTRLWDTQKINLLHNILQDETNKLKLMKEEQEKRDKEAKELTEKTGAARYLTGMQARDMGDFSSKIRDGIYNTMLERNKEMPLSVITKLIEEAIKPNEITGNVSANKKYLFKTGEESDTPAYVKPEKPEKPRKDETPVSKNELLYWAKTFRKNGFDDHDLYGIISRNKTITQGELESMIDRFKLNHPEVTTTKSIETTPEGEVMKRVETERNKSRINNKLRPAFEDGQSYSHLWR